ncbi:MAG TPA: sigma-70 family RNA polymerase sigma factor [Acidimicrobiales bacterium]
MDDLTRLALAAQAGDDEALAALIRATQADVWRVCAHVAGRQRADDVTQDAFVRAWRSLPRFRADASVRTWLLAVARNTAIDALRNAARRPGTVALLELAGEAAADPAGEVTTASLLDGLESDRRTALFLTQLLGLTYAEAAAVCGVPIGTIRSRVARAREDLAGDLGAAAGP